MKKHALRKVVAAVALAGALIGVVAGPASADQTNVNGTVHAAIGCDFGYHTLSLSGSFRLSSRYPNGAWITSRYAFYNVNPNTGVRTTAIAYTPFTNSWAVAGTVSWSTSLAEGYKAQYSTLPGWTYSKVSGSFGAQVQVGVWNGKAYEYSNFDVPTSYINVYMNKPWMSGPTCTGSV